MPAILVHELDGESYRLVQTLVAGQVDEARLPFPVRLDPGQL